MKKLLFIVFICTFVSCSVKRVTSSNINKQYVFLLNDNDTSKYYLNDTVKTAYKNGSIIKSPLVVINGYIFKYKQSQDTVFLPIGKKDIRIIVILDKKDSHVIYGEQEINGAIIINTNNLNDKYISIEK